MTTWYKHILPGVRENGESSGGSNGGGPKIDEEKRLTIEESDFYFNIPEMDIKSLIISTEQEIKIL